jgi:hypothetical protein
MHAKWILATCAALALLILTGCKTPATQQSPFPRMLDPVTEEVPRVLFK